MEELAAWRAVALERFGYFAEIMFALTPINAPGLGTWAVDAGNRLYIDFEAVRSRGFTWNMESVPHECSHVFAGHSHLPTELGESGQPRVDRKVSNLAADYSINDDLTDAGCITFRSDGVLPDAIGEPWHQTPHHYYRALRALQTKATQQRQPSLSLTPNRIPAGAVAGTTLTATATPPFTSAPALSVTDAKGQPVAVSLARTTNASVTFTLAGDLPPGVYRATATAPSANDAGESREALFEVVEPSITLTPNRIGRGVGAPTSVEIVGSLTAFTDHAQIIMTHPEDGTPVPISGVVWHSATRIDFVVPPGLDDGVYLVSVADGGRTVETTLPVGIAQMELSPATLPLAHPAGQAIFGIVDDFALDATTTVEITGLLTGPMPDAVATVAVRTDRTLAFTLSAPLPEGGYMVTATTGSEVVAAGLSVTDQQNDDSGGGGAQGDEPQDGGDGAGEPYKGCGSGSGGEPWEGELDLDDDFDGYAPAMSPEEQDVLQIKTAGAIIEQAEKSQGSVPAGLLDYARMVLAPSATPWQQVLGSNFRRCVSKTFGHFDADYSRVNRRRHRETVLTPGGPRRVVRPGTYKPQPVVAVLRDTSGSMTDEDEAMVLREIEAIARKVGIRGDDLTVTDCDAVVYGTRKYKGRASVAAFTGRGGTSMTRGIEALWERKPCPSVIVVATDGDTDWPQERGPVPVIACIVTRNPDNVTPTPEWMKTVIVTPT